MEWPATLGVRFFGCTVVFRTSQPRASSIDFAQRLVKALNLRPD